MVLLLAIVLTYIYYQVSFGAENTDKVFITITTFFFSIFMSFFITRQGARYTKLREIISTYDGKMSSSYRAAGNISIEIQQKIGDVIKSHYKKILETQSWDYHFINKSSTISDIHAIAEEDIGSNNLGPLRMQALSRVLSNLGDCQVLRKNMVMLYEEKIPLFQWILILVFVFILLASISVIPSVGFLLGSVLKACFAVAIISIVLILQNLDDLHLFENFIGEKSAEDVINTIEGLK